MSGIEIRLLGPPDISVEGGPLEVDTRKAVALLSYLAVEGGLHQREALAGLLWPDYGREAARGALRRTLSNLRKALGGRFLIVDRQLIGLDLQDVTVDTADFLSLVETSVDVGGDGAAGPPLSQLEAATSLYRGDFMHGFALRDSVDFEEWQLYQSDRFRRLLASALDRLAGELQAAGRDAAAIETAQRRLALDPLHEPAHRLVMILYASSGKRAEALRQYRTCVAVLERELGVPPLSDTTDLYQAIKEERLPPPRPAGSGPTVRPVVPGPPFIGRDDDLAELHRAYNGLDASVRFVAIEGEAGVGKTRLAEEFVTEVSGRGAIVVTTKCFEEERDLAYGPIIDVFRSTLARDPGWVERLPTSETEEVARLLPDAVEGVHPPATRDPAAQSRFIRGIGRALLASNAGPKPGVLFIDDVQWADSSSLDVLGWLLRRGANTPLLIIGAYRNEDAIATHRLRRQLPAHTSIHLVRFAEDDVRALVGGAGFDLPTEEFVARLYRETEGLPFFLVEYIASLGTNPTAGEWKWPQGVRDVLSARVYNAGEVARQLLAAAAVVGRAFEFDIVREASGRSDEESVAGIEELVALGLIADVRDGDSSPATYDFRHEKIREFVYDQTGQARRRLLHSRVADALLRASHGLPTGGRTWLAVANHSRLAGRDRDAAIYFALAGEESRRVFANAEAIASFRSALAAGHPEPARIHEAIGDLETLTGEYRAALFSYETAAALSSSDAVATVEHKLGRVHHRRGDWQSAVSHYQTALGQAGDDDSFRSRILSDWSLSLHHARDSESAWGLAQDALGLAEKSNDDEARAQANNVLGILAARKQQFDTALAYLEHSRELARKTKDPTGEIAALNNMALAHRAAGRVERALELTHESLRLCEEQGDRHREAALHNNLADLLQVSGRSDEAMDHLKRAVAIFAEVGAPGEMEPAIWKLVEW